ncbi:MAG: chemotaxis protein CheB [Janthinobacterium lividum]
MNALLADIARGHPVDAVVIGASAGGINALLSILPGLPLPCPFAVVIVLHLPDDGDSRLAELFAQRLGRPVCEAADKMPVVPGMIYFAPSGYHLALEAERCFSLSREAPVHFSRPAIDILMASAADVYASHLAGLLLTGASADGAAGLASIAGAGGLTVVQQPAEAESAIMPLAAIGLFTPDLVLPLADIRNLLNMLETH